MYQLGAFQVAQWVKNPPAIQETQVQSLGQEDPLDQCMKVKSESEVAQLCPTLSDPMDGSLPGSSINGIFQARVWDRRVRPRLV